VKCYRDCKLGLDLAYEISDYHKSRNKEHFDSAKEGWEKGM
jgi:hypothetical protein